MPEYSSTTITPSDTVQVPMMNGSTPGNATLASLKAYYLAALGQASGIATLDANGKLTSTEIPDSLDDVLVYAAYANYPNPGEEGKLYIAKAEGQMHYWSGSAYVQINTPLTQSVTNGNTTEAPSSDAVYDAIASEAITRANMDSQLDKRVTNLEQKAGDYSETRFYNAPSGVVPSSKASYGIWTTQRGVTRGWNQLVKNGDFPDDADWNKENGVTATYSGNVATISSSVSGNGINRIINFINGHIYYISAETNTESALSVRFGSNTGSGCQLQITTTEFNKFVLYNGVFTASANSLRFYIFALGTYSNLKVRNVQCIDLTLLFGSGNEPSTVAEALQRCPQLGQYNSYDAGSLVSNTVSGLTSKSRNVWDEEWVVGNTNTSGNIDTSDTDRISSKNLIPVLPNTSYYVYAPNANGRKCFYDANGEFISISYSFNSGMVFTTPEDAFYMRFCAGASYGTTYNNDICINLSDSQDGTYTPYWSPVTLSLPSSVTLRRAGSVADSLDVASGVVTRNVGTITLDGSDDEPLILYSSTYDGFRFDISTMKVDGVDPSEQVTSDKFIVNTIRGSSTLLSGLIIKTYGATSDDQYLFLCGSGETTLEGFKTWLRNNNTTINFKLATPTTENIGTLTDNLIYTESGGTLTPVQTQTPTIDTDFSVGFLAV